MEIGDIKTDILNIKEKNGDAKDLYKDAKKKGLACISKAEKAHPKKSAEFQALNQEFIKDTNEIQKCADMDCKGDALDTITSKLVNVGKEFFKETGNNQEDLELEARQTSGEYEHERSGSLGGALLGKGRPQACQKTYVCKAGDMYHGRPCCPSCYYKQKRIQYTCVRY